MRVAVLIACGLFVVALLGTTLAARLAPPGEGRGAAVVSPSRTPVPVSTPASTPVTSTPPATPASVATPVGAPPAVTATAPPSPTGAPTPPTAYTYADVAMHASAEDCWIVVAGRIYDVTRYLRSHPGGDETITLWCGKESTVAYETEDGVGTHSTRADRLLESYFIADLR